MGRAGVALALVTLAVAASASAQPALSSAATAVKFRRSVECGAGFRASVTFWNDGSVPWRFGDVALGAVDDTDPFTPERRLLLPAGSEVAPGESHTFELRLTAPAIPLEQALSDWRLVTADGTWFGAVAAARVSVRCPARIDDADLVSAVLPTEVRCGGRYEGSITLRNSGTTTWSEKDGYSLVEVSGGDDLFAPRRAALPANQMVAPGAEASIPIAVRAPARGGSFPMDWRMARRGGAFGESVTQQVRVRCPAP